MRFKRVCEAEDDEEAAEGDEDYEEPGVFIYGQIYNSDIDFSYDGISYQIIFGDISNALNESDYQYLEYYRHYYINDQNTNSLETTFYRIIKMCINRNQIKY